MKSSWWSNKAQWLVNKPQPNCHYVEPTNCTTPRACCQKLPRDDTVSHND